MKRSTLALFAVFAVCWSLGFSAVVFAVAGRMSGSQLAAVGLVLALILASIFVPTIRYRP